jgi:hypothetical protein
VTKSHQPRRWYGISVLQRGSATSSNA